VRRHAIRVALVTLGTVGALGFTPVATADESDSVRPTAVEGRFWIYEFANYGGDSKSYNGNDRWFANDEWDGTNTSVDNQTSSAGNATNQWGTLWQIGNSSGGDCSGYGLAIPPGTGVPDMGDYTFNNRASCIIFG
jgi:hypothetical protein